MKKKLAWLLLLVSLSGCGRVEQAVMETEEKVDYINIDCHMCGLNSVWAYGKKKDLVGVVNLANGQVIDLDLLPYDDYGKLQKDGGSRSIVRVTDGDGRIARFWMDSVRGMCTIDLSWEEAESFELSEVEGLYCEVCMNKIRELKAEQEKYLPDSEMCPFTIVDFQTGEMYSLNGILTACLIRDFYLNLDADDKKLEAFVVYVPERLYK